MTVNLLPLIVDQPVVHAGLFIYVYAATSVKFINDPNALDPREQFDIIRGLRASSNQPHAQLYALYLQVLQSAFPSPSVDADDDRVRRILGAMLSGQLSVDALAIFVGIAQDVLVRVLSRLRSIVTTAEDKPRFYHLSVEESIAQRCSEFAVVPAFNERVLALRCLKVLQTPLGPATDAADGPPGVAFRYSGAVWEDHFDRACLLNAEDLGIIHDLFAALEEFDLRVYMPLLRAYIFIRVHVQVFYQTAASILYHLGRAQFDTLKHRTVYVAKFAFDAALLLPALFQASWQ
ncbi:hypothetical protein FA95DRAFT_1604638 [Auriscalpium vulgare]|uniref:Uncharacterized protein n=1 Tax=Auriscalpium vulgare TaxID=40419 RepID=A0ACB8RZH0_9AGAM|nr:hypothetical protein FA95DRAFT_1604638 [Auriscalpium vulgare]